MKLTIIAFGVFILVMAALLAARPKAVTDFLVGNAGETWMHVAAAGIRIVMGMILILYAAESRFPGILLVLGWLAVVAGTVLAVLPRARFNRLVTWAFERFGHLARAAGFAAILLGGFLVYAVI